MKKMSVVLAIVIALIMNGCSNEVVLKNKIEADENEKTEVHFLRLDEGRCIVSTLANGECIVIDSGSADDFPKVYEYIRNMGINIIDYFVITAADRTHMGGAAKLLQNFQVNDIYISERIINSALYRHTVSAAKEEKCKVNKISGGTEVLSEFGLDITAASPIESNYDDVYDYSISIIISYKNNRFFIEGDCTDKSEYDMLMSFGEYMKSDVFCASKNIEPSSAAFIQKISPDYAVVYKKENDEPDRLKRLKESLEITGACVLRTDVNGSIVFTSDGSNIMVKTEG